MCEDFACMYVCICACVLHARKGKKMASELPKLEIQVSVSHHVSGRNQTQVLDQSNKCS